MQQSLTGDLASAAARVLDVARKRNLTIVTAESCTAGMLSTILSEAPGASEHLHGGCDLHQKEQNQSSGRFGTSSDREECRVSGRGHGHGGRGSEALAG
jgi:nicotinamide mononucleotide (NMN) deamidase PncC